mgnify:CR=1 FL=1
MEHRTAVMHVMTLDYTFERRLELQRAEAEELEETPEMIRALYEQMQARDTKADR